MSVNVRKLVLPAGRLPDCPRDRRAQLDAYFDDLLASVKAVPEGWEIDLNWPSTADYYVDPGIEQGLEWWGPGTSISEIHTQVSHTPRGQLALRDAWTLYSWSDWLAERRKRSIATEEVVILHVDDHNDLMTPRLTLNGDTWRDMISGDVFDIHEPASVRSAILNGAVGVGSFMSPLIHAIPRVHLRHLSQSVADEDVQDHSLVRQSVRDTLLRIDALRPGIGITPVPEGTEKANAGLYRFTRSLDKWLGDLPSSPILLHVDMDYFNNRYNGDSDWIGRQQRHDPAIPEIMRSIDSLFAAVRSTGVASSIENVTVALSPGFFPAELWAASLARMQEHATMLGWEIRTPER